MKKKKGFTKRIDRIEYLKSQIDKYEIMYISEDFKDRRLDIRDELIRYKRELIKLTTNESLSKTNIYLDNYPSYYGSGKGVLNCTKL